ncbi:hypothetical protein ACFL08_03680 [Patescibacteria group bacterium]
MKKNIVEWGLLSLLISLSLVSWWSVDNIIFSSQSISWSFSVIMFSLLIALFYLFLIIEKKKVIIFLGIACAFFSSLIFAPELYHFLFILISFFLASLAHFMIKREMGLITSVEVWRIVRPAKILIILAITLTIASQHHYSTLNSDVGNNIPEVKLGKTESKLAASLIALFNEDFTVENMESVTVDDFLLGQIKKNSEKNAGVIVDETMLELYYSKAVSEGRSNFAELAGRDIVGDEKAFDVFSEVVNNKINEFFGKNISPEVVAFIPWTIFVFLFIMVFSIASVLMPFIIIFAKLVFYILVKIKVIDLDFEDIKKEIIV